MRFFVAFFVWLVSFIPAVVIADSAVDEISSNPIQTFRFDDGFGPDLVAGLCDLGNIQNTGKLRVR